MSQQFTDSSWFDLAIADQEIVPEVNHRREEIDDARPRQRMCGDVLVECMSFLDPDQIEASLFVCRSWYRTQRQNEKVLPLRVFDRAEMRAAAPGMFSLTCTLYGFIFQYQAPFLELCFYVETLLKRSYIALLTLDGCIDWYRKFALFDAMRSNIVVSELRISATSAYSSETLAAICGEAVRHWKAATLGLHNPMDAEIVFGSTQIVIRLQRLEVSVPTVDCRTELDRLLFGGNANLDVCLRFVNGRLPEAVICFEERFWSHYFGSVLHRLCSGSEDSVFVKTLRIRAVYDPLLEARLSPQVLKEIGVAESSDVNFCIYDCIAAKGRPYHVLWAHQTFEDPSGYWLDSVLYYLIAPGKLSARQDSGKIAHSHQLEDWIVRELRWECWREAPPTEENGQPVTWSWFPYDGYSH